MSDDSVYNKQFLTVLLSKGMTYAFILISSGCRYIRKNGIINIKIHVFFY